jgi:hypothetical protein
MGNPRLFIALATALVCLNVGAARITFERVVPAPHDLRGAQDLAVVSAMGDNDRITTFLDVFIDQTNRSETLRVHDATSLGVVSNAASRRRLHRMFGAQLYLRVTAFTCQTERKSGEGSSSDFEGKRVRRKQQWVDCVCSAHIDILDPDSLRVISSFNTRGEGTSPRVVELSDEERFTATEQAARYAAVAAAEEITPRRVRETITLDDRAPAFSDAVSMIDTGRLEEARRVWDGAALRKPASAPLHFNLAAVCEALGDIPSAREHYREAVRLAPGQSRYRAELEMFRRRYRLKP